MLMMEDKRNNMVMEDKRSAEARSTYLTDYELNNNRSSVESDKHLHHDQHLHHHDQQPHLQHNRLAALKTSPTSHQHSVYSNVVETGGINQSGVSPTSFNQSETTIISSVRSEDELSGVSSHSPHR